MVTVTRTACSWWTPQCGPLGCICLSSLKSEVSFSLSPVRSATITSSNLNVRCVGCLSCWPWCHGFVMGYTTCCTHKGWNLDSIHVVLGVCADQLPIYTLIQRWFSHSNFHTVDPHGTSWYGWWLEAVQTLCMNILVHWELAEHPLQTQLKLVHMYTNMQLLVYSRYSITHLKNSGTLSTSSMSRSLGS